MARPSDNADARRDAAIAKAAAEAVTAPKPFDPTALLSAGSGMAAAEKARQSVLAQGGSASGAAASARYTGQAYDYYAKEKAIADAAAAAEAAAAAAAKAAADEAARKAAEEASRRAAVLGGPTIAPTVSPTGNISTAGVSVPTVAKPIITAENVEIGSKYSVLNSIRFVLGIRCECNGVTIHITFRCSCHRRCCGYFRAILITHNPIVIVGI